MAIKYNSLQQTRRPIGGEKSKGGGKTPERTEERGTDGGEWDGGEKAWGLMQNGKQEVGVQDGFRCEKSGRLSATRRRCLSWTGGSPKCRKTRFWRAKKVGSRDSVKLWWWTIAAAATVALLSERIPCFSFRCWECERRVGLFLLLKKKKKVRRVVFHAPQSGALLLVLVSMQYLQVWGAASKSSFCLPDESYRKHLQCPNYVFMCLPNFSVFRVVQRSFECCFILCARNICTTSMFTVVEAKLLPGVWTSRCVLGRYSRYLLNGLEATHWNALPARRGAFCMLIGG